MAAIENEELIFPHESLLYHWDDFPRRQQRSIMINILHKEITIECEDQERRRVKSECDRQRHCTPFGETTC